MQEIWKDVVWYEWRYQVSNLWNIMSLNYNNLGKTKLLKVHKNSKWYLMVKLSKDWKGYWYSVHRLVWQAFLWSIWNLQTNHKDGNKTNNCVDNLEYCTASENNLHKYNVLKYKHYGAKWKDNRLSKPVLQYDINWVYMKKYSCIMEAYRETNINYWNISNCCNGERKKAGWFIWKFL